MCVGNVLGDVVVQVQLMGKLVCAGGIWGPALTSTLFLWPALKGGFGVGAREVGRHLEVSGWKAGLCRPLNVFQVCDIHQYYLSCSPSRAGCDLVVGRTWGVLRSGRPLGLAHKEREGLILL